MVIKRKSIQGSGLLGAAIEYEAIPDDFKADLEMHDLILQMADDLYLGEVCASCRN